MKRPYLKLRLTEIEDLISKDDDIDMNDIINELSQRNSSKAKNLLNKLNKSQKSKKVKAKSKKLNDRVKSNDISEIDDSSSKFIEDSNVFINFINALEIEINEIKKKSIEQTIDLTNGKLTDKAYDQFIYYFSYRESTSIREDIPIILIIGAKEVSGTVVSFLNNSITISVEENFGNTINFCQLKIDNSFLLIKLKERLEDINRLENNSIFNSGMAKKVLGESKSKISIDNKIKQIPTLNNNQLESLRVAAGSEVMYLWGPPGTGKTFTLAEVINMFYQQNKKILLVSNTNLAVDLLLFSICKHLDKIKDKDFHNCSVLRFGKIINEELNKEYSEYINIDNAAARLSQKLSNEKTLLEKKINQINRAMTPELKIKESFDNQNDNLERIKNFQEIKRNLEDNLKNNKKRIDNFKKTIKSLENETKISENSNQMSKWFLGRRNVEDIQNDIIKTKNDMNQINIDINSTPIKLDENKNIIENIKKENHKLNAIIKNVDIKETLKKIETYNKQKNEISNKISTIQSEINEIKDKLIKNCRVVAATATQTFLKHKEFQLFDVVIIDESSMLPLPLVAYVSGLAKEHVTVTGDFQQLPPIVSARNEPSVMKWIGNDVFNKSGVEKAIKKNNKPKNLIQLKNQYRMDKSICNLINDRFYYGSLVTERSAGKEKNKYPSILSNPLIIIDTSKQYPFNNTKPRTFSRYNILHSILARNLTVYLNDKKLIINNNDLGIISPYSAQTDLISNILKEKDILNVEVGTVHKFQGNQKDIIIFDLVDSFGLSYISNLLKDYKLLNVAISRAKGFLIIIANIDYLESKLEPSSIIREILYDIQSNGQVINSKKIFKLNPDFKEIYHQPIKKNKIDYKRNGTAIYDQTTFDDAILKDIKKAKKWVVIFSGFSTPKRVAFWSDIFRQKLLEGVIIRCVTRSPQNQGNIDSDSALEAIEKLVNIGVIVDLRHQIHEKTIFIDDNIVWTGSLNPLSHTGKTEEQMIRDSSKQLSLIIAKFHVHKRGFKATDTPYDIITKKENPTCPECDNLVVFHHIGKFGPFYSCERCNWKENLDIYNRKKNIKNNNKGLSKPISKEEDIECSKCGDNMKLRSGKYGYFYGCTNYPNCKNTEKYIN